MELTIGLKSILGWERLPLFGRYGYVEMIMCLTTKTLLFCRLYIYRATGTLRLWSSLQRPRDRDLYMEVCARLEATVRDTFSQYGWPHSLRIGAAS
jgi:hypothetical protein